MTDAEFGGRFEDEGGWQGIHTRRGPIVAVGPPLTDADIVTAEQRLSVVVPDSYKRWLLHCNGGIPKCGNFKSAYFSWQNEQGLTRADSVDVLFGVRHSSERMDLVYDNTSVMNSRTPDGFISIGMPNWEDDDRRLLLKVAGDDLGAVYDWLDFGSSTALFRCASDFEEFWDSLLVEFPETPRT